MATKVAVVSTVAEPLVWVSHQTSENWTSRLPTSENTCPVQMAKNGICHLEERTVGSSMPTPHDWPPSELHLLRVSH
jgi:hypothetical protein